MDELREPILSLLGHVDHGKTTLLDRIAGSVRAANEAGGITQHIGAVEIPRETVLEICRGILKTEQFNVPGLLIVDTPGHRSFETLRRRGGALADIAILVVDGREGVMPQTRESIQILKHAKTPFAVALTKVDLLSGWRKPTTPHVPLREQLERCGPEFGKVLDEHVYAVAEQLVEFGLSADRFDRVSDFTRNIGIVPVSAKSGIGVPELLALIVGLAQRFLREELALQTDSAEGTVLERSDQRGVGPVASIILYRGALTAGDELVVNGRDAPFVTRLRGIYRPAARRGKGGGAMHLEQQERVSAAAGVYLAAPGIEDALPGGVVKAVHTAAQRDEAIQALAREAATSVPLSESGVQICTDTLGALEALTFECAEAKIPIHGAAVSPVTRALVLRTSSVRDPLDRAILAFNVPILPDAGPLGVEDVKIFKGEVMYRVLEEYQTWRQERMQAMASRRRIDFVHPAKFKVLPGFVFRSSKPAIVGIQVLAGQLRSGVRIMKADGTEIAVLKSLQRESESVKEASEGAELAASLDGAVIGRNLKEGDVLYVSMPEAAVRGLKGHPLTPNEEAVLAEIIRIRRATQGPFWGQ
jgi:translation initiation factor 5B